MSKVAPAFSLAQIYLSKAEFSYRVNPLLVAPDAKPSPQEVRTGVAVVRMTDPDVAQVKFRVASNPDKKEEQALYDFDVEVAGIVRGVADKETFSDRALAVLVGTMLAPFVREMIANLTMRGRFGPIWIQPVNVQRLIDTSTFRELEPDAPAPIEQLPVARKKPKRKKPQRRET
jgi:preprotein translocase subunit SecB